MKTFSSVLTFGMLLMAGCGLDKPPTAGTYQVFTAQAVTTSTCIAGVQNGITTLCVSVQIHWGTAQTLMTVFVTDCSLGPPESCASAIKAGQTAAVSIVQPLVSGWQTSLISSPSVATIAQLDGKARDEVKFTVSRTEAADVLTELQTVAITLQ